MDTNVDVIIVGYGPGGAVLASVLGQRGHKVIVLEKYPSPYNLPRLSTIHGEISRIMQHAADPVAALEGALPMTVIYSYGANGDLLRTLTIDETSCGHPRMLSQHQPVIERAIHERVESLDNVQVLWGHTATHVEDFGYGVVVTVNSQNGDTITLRGNYVVGMDGASSMVRKSVGIGMDVLAILDDDWVLTDFDIIDPSVPDPPMEAHMEVAHPFYWGPNGARRCRTDVRMEPSDPPERRTEKAALQFVEDRLGVPQDALRVTRHVTYKFRSEIAERMRVGNIFIGGDAAHLMPPTMAEGAASAMRDALNLGWRLDLVLRGAAAGSLLDAYEQERLSNVGPLVQGSLMTVTLVGERDPARAAARDAMLRSGVPPMPGSALTAGLIVVDEDGFPVEPAGFLSPQGRVRIGSREGLLDDIIGFGSQLVSTVPLDDLLGEAPRQRLEALGVRLIVLGDRGGDALELDTQYREFFDKHHVVAYLSRPDFYIYGAAATAADIPGLVDGFIDAIPTLDEAKGATTQAPIAHRLPGEPFTYGSVEAGGYSLTYAVAGRADSTVTIVSVPGSAGIEMSTAKDLLSEQFRIIEINPPGWGDQDNVVAPARAVDVAAVLVAAIGRLVAGPYYLIGTSIGGPIALYIAEKETRQLQGIILEGGMVAITPDDVLPWTPKVLVHPNKPWATANFVQRQMTNRMRLIMGMEPDMTAESGVRAVNDRAIPVLALLGEQEEILRPSARDSYVAAMPHAQTAIVAKARHDIQNTNAHEFVRLVQSLIGATRSVLTDQQESECIP